MIGFATVQALRWSELVRIWRDLEERGFDHIWVVDHLVAFPKSGPLLEAWTTLAGAAAVTERIRIGTMVTNITYRNPAVVAKQALTVDQISNGRVEVGIGAAGTRSGDAEVAGVPDPSPSERAERLAEFAEVIDSLLRGGPSYDGVYYSSTGFTGEGVQRPRPPLTIAAHGPKTLRVAAHLADRWSVLVGTNWEAGQLTEGVRELNGRLEEMIEEAGREPGDVIRSAYVGKALPRDSVEALRDFIGAYREAGIDEFVFVHPRPFVEEAEAQRILDLAAEVRTA